MNNQTNQTNQTNQKVIKQAYGAGRDAIIKTLGKGRTQEDEINVVMLMAHALLTSNQTLDLTLSEHNTKEFLKALLVLVRSTQSNTESGSHCGRLM